MKSVDPASPTALSRMKAHIDRLADAKKINPRNTLVLDLRVPPSYGGSLESLKRFPNYVRYSMLLTVFCFDIGSVSPDALAQIIEKSVNFVPSHIRCSEFCRTGGAYKAHHLQKLRMLKNVSTLELETDEGMKGEYFLFSTLGAYGFHVLYWNTLQAITPDFAYFDQLAQSRGFNTGYCCDSEFVFWQCVESLNTYELYHRSAQHLAKVVDPDFETEKIDISQNPGRRTGFPGMWLQAGWRMWFGPGAFACLPPDRLMSFEGCHGRKILPNGTVFIELFKDVEDTEKPENLRRHKEFRDWLGMDQLEARAGEFAESKADPSTEIKQGVFPHGGVWRITQWFDETGGLKRRSLAAYRKAYEMDAACKPVWYSDRLPVRD